MKKDIEKVENLIKKCDECKLKECINCEISWSEISSVRRLVDKYKELEEENKIIKGNYYTLCADIQMVTSELGFPEDTIIADEMVSMIKDNYIPVSLVEETILNPMKEEHDKAIKGFIKRDIPQCIEDGGIAQELGYFIGKIEELLEKRK